MVGKWKSSKERRRLEYVPGSVEPEDFLHFVQWSSFVDDWKNLGLDDDDLRALETAIMLGPKQSPVVGGTGGLRKLRFAPKDSSKGKRGSCRVCYVYFEDQCLVLLLVAYAKNERDNLSAGEKRQIQRLIGEIGDYLAGKGR